VLRSWTEHLRIYLHSEQVVLVREVGLIKRRIGAKQTIPVNVQGEHSWSGALATLETILNAPEWQHARASVTLSSHFMRYRVVPWDGRLSNEERDALLRHRFEEVYGNEVQGWQLVAAGAGYGKQGLVGAVDARLMTRLQDVFTRSTVQLVSVKPLLMTAFNRWRREIDGRGAWVVLAEQSFLTIGLVQGGEWRSIRSKNYGTGWEETLSLLLEREALHLGVDATTFPVYLWRPDKPFFKPSLSQEQLVQLLRLPVRLGFSPDGDKDYALALC